MPSIDYFGALLGGASQDRYLPPTNMFHRTACTKSRHSLAAIVAVQRCGQTRSAIPLGWEPLDWVMRQPSRRIWHALVHGKLRTIYSVLLERLQLVWHACARSSYLVCDPM